MGRPDRTRRRGAVAVAALLAAAGCGGGEDAGRPELLVSAASSLRAALTDCAGDTGARVRLSFGGSDELAAQIRRGVRPDVFAAADTDLPAALAREGRLGRPLAFATNELVLAVPADGDVASLADAATEGRRLAVGSPSVPVGRYTREVLGRLPRAVRDGLRANVRTEEPDVAGVVGKLANGAVDAGFVYRTDVTASGGRLRAIALPARLRPRVAYAAGVVRGGPGDPAEARRWVAGLRDGPCARALRAAGFGAPPG